MCCCAGPQEASELIHHAQVKKSLCIPIQPPRETWGKVVNGGQQNPFLMGQTEFESVSAETDSNSV